MAWTPHPKQQQFLELQTEEALFGGSAGGGKMLRIDEPIPTPSGWTTMGALRAGDTVFDEHGDQCSVVAAHPAVAGAEAWKITFDDGTSIEACSDHLWLTYDAKELGRLTTTTEAWKAARRARRPARGTGKKPWLGERNSRTARGGPPPSGTVRTTREIAATVRTATGRANHAIPVCEPLQMGGHGLPLSPYLLGCWLGDGTTSAGSITSGDPEILQAFERSFPRGFTSPGSGCVTAGFKGLTKSLRDLGVLGNKHIPGAYLYSDISQRAALLQGLMDTDGCVTKAGGAEFCTTTHILALQVHELILSLGSKATICTGRATLNGRYIGPKYTIKWSPGFQVFRLRRKADRLKLAHRRTTRFRYITSVTPCPPSPMRCITVDSWSGLYLASRSLVPTHNTDSLLAVPLRYIHHAELRFLFLRRTMPQLRHAIGKSFPLYKGIDPGAKFDRQEKVWKFSSGAEGWFAYLDSPQDVWRYHGQEFQIALWDELTEHETSEAYFWMFTRMRAANRFMPCPIVRASTNPGGPGHRWVKERFIDPWPAGGRVLRDAKTGHRRIFIPATVYDNPSIDGDDYLRGFLHLPHWRYEALAKGSWDVFEGAAFKLAPDMFLSDPDWWPEPSLYRWRSMDWGMDKPGCVLWHAIDADGVVYTYRELYFRDEDPARVAERVLRIEADAGERGIYGYADPSIVSRTHGPSIMEVFARNGVRWIQADNDRQQGFAEIYTRVARRRSVTIEGVEQERPWWYIHKRCRYLRKSLAAIQAHPYKEDVNTDGDDHGYDTARYGLMHKPLIRVPQFLGRGAARSRENPAYRRMWAGRDPQTGI